VRRQVHTAYRGRIVKLRSGFLATTVPGSTCLNRDGQPIGAEFDEYATMPTDAQLEKPLAELFAHVPQEPWPDMHVPCGDLGCSRFNLRVRHGIDDEETA